MRFKFLTLTSSFPKLTFCFKYGIIFFTCIFLLKLLSYLDFQYYEGGVDSILNVAIEGILSNGNGSIPYATGKWIFISSIQGFLYSLAPHINWYSASVIFFSACNMMLFLENLKLAINNGTEGRKFFFKNCLLIIISILFIENLVFIQYTRVAYFSSFLGLLLVIQYYIKDRKINYAILSIGTFFFMIGAMIRIESALLGLVVLMPYFYYLYGTKLISLKTSFVFLAGPALFCIMISLLMNLPRNDIDKNVALFNRFLHNADGNQYKTEQLSIDNREDSLAYEITFISFLNDPEHINENFVQRINLRPMLSFNAIKDYVTNTDKFVLKLQDISNRYILYHYGYVAIFILSGLSVIVFSSNKKDLKSAVLIFIYYVLLFVLITGYAKMEERVFGPLFLSYSFLLGLIINNKKISSMITILFLVVAWLSVAREAINIKEKIVGKRKEAEYFSGMINYSSSFNKEYIILDLISLQSLHASPFKSIDIEKDKIYLSIDNGFLFALAGYAEKMKEITGGDDILSFWNFVSENTEDCIFVAQKNRFEKIIEYSNAQYSLLLTPTAIIEDEPVDSTTNSYYEYQYINVFSVK